MNLRFQYSFLIPHSSKLKMPITNYQLPITNYQLPISQTFPSGEVQNGQSSRRYQRESAPTI
ncbi:MAG TPA: hypothetical protein DDW76_11565 [Cyanobacteria bacterium UBA11369]|nr:hypothetical protein [Cyanobacteria bacterium UBA11371]HBE30282.1 hypothetical protein [Cyanobacteria bacterium UBA11368]HBE49409.1 hypothetical protein [Cyanobacteria bacterium UBA11369]